MIVGMLAILKAGGAYVPLDPTYPGERLRGIFADANPFILVADKTGRAALDNSTLRSLILVDPSTSLTQPGLNPCLDELTPRNLAYVIYTSGSTGKPKGVMVEHRGVASLVQYHSELIGVHEGSRMLQFASISFDFSVWEIFLALCSGATLILAPSKIRMDRDLLWNFMIQQSVTHATFTPSFLQDGKGLPKSVNPLILTLGGEALGPTLLQNLIRQGITVFNDYGPTEASISAATWKCTAAFEGDVVPIGRPVRNAQLYVLDEHQQPVSLGAVGELYLSGVGLARGYLNRPEQTAERFLKDPFGCDEDARMYRTGDLVRYLPDGNLVYLGRTDHQVKIRGFRIELGEIEAALTDHKWVSEAAVLAVGSDNDKHLVAYVVADPHDDLPHRLRAHLVGKLPLYMVPAAYVRLDAMPRTANEKLDRKALPVPNEDSYAREAYEAPQGEIEIRLAGIWTLLLQMTRISRHDNFFALGGHSLQAAKMLDHLRRIGLSVPVRALFEFPTLNALAKCVISYQADAIPPNLITLESDELTPKMLPLVDLNQSDIDHIVQRIPGGLSNIQDIYPLTPLQDGILFHHLLATKGDPYLLTATIAFETRQLLDRYLAAFQTVVDRHDILRTAFFWESITTSVQVVCRHAPLIIQELSLDPADGPLLEQLDRRYNPKHYRIDLNQAPLLRFVIAQDTDGRWMLVQLVHHLIGDHTAEEEIHAEIKLILDGEGRSLPAPLHFRDHLAQKRLKSSPEDHEQFFKKMLGDVDEPTLPFGLTSVSDGGAEIEESYKMIPQELNDRLRTLAKRLKVSLAAICHVAWAQVLARTSEQKSVVFGTVLFGRLQGGNGSGHALGLSMNTLPIRCDISDSCAFESIQDTHARLTALLEHEHASLALAQRCSGVAAGTPLFSGLLNFRHSTALSTNGIGTADGELISQEGWFEYPGLEFLRSQERTNYPFSISVEDYGTALGLTAQTVRPQDPRRVCGYMQQALDSLATALECNSKMPVARLNVLPPEEHTLLLDTWNETAEDYPDHLCLHQLFEQQVECTPDTLAVVCEDKSLTYRELNARSNGLAHHLIQLGVRTDDVVAVCVERSVEMIVGILAVLKAGGAYVPLDPFFASDRLKDIMSDAAPVVLLADEAGRAALGQSAVADVVVVDPSLITTMADSPPRVAGLSSMNLAYVIYTSGTTGKPKGVMVEHQGVVNLVASQQPLLNIQSSSRMTQFLSISFDPSVWEIFATLSFGGALHVLKEDVRRDFRQLWAYLQLNQITHAIFTPAVIQDCEGLPPLKSMSTLLIGGEALSGALVRRVGDLVPNAAIINEYGPTEASIAALSWTYVEGGLIGDDIVPIGHPLSSKRVYILDEFGHPLPLGVAGELYLGGVGVARGYLNRPDLTAEKFVLDRFSRETGARMYKTGDMAKYHIDGRVICLGRNDDQVKIRGFRVELGEIEARLVEHPQVSEAAVAPLGKGGNMRLVAYVIARDQGVIEQHGDRCQPAASAELAASLRNHLLAKLPDYMVPSAFVRLTSFPLTTNGKLDRRALPAPGEDDYARKSYEAPQGEVETAIAGIWSELLQVNRVSRRDSFFALGGHSLLAVRLINRVSALGATVAISALFASPSLAAFASHVEDLLAQQEQVSEAILPISRDNALPLSFAQQRLWFLAQLDGASDTYHIPLAIRLQGALDRSALAHALDALVTRHEALRTVFVAVNGQPQVKILQPQASILRTADLRGSAYQDELLKSSVHKEISEPFELTEGPLIRALLIELQDDEWVLLITQHHIVSDGWSSGIMLQELSQLYTAYCNGEASPLAPLRIQYPDYAAWQREWLSGDRLRIQSDYWRTALAGSPVLLDLPTDRPRPPQQSFKGDHVPIELDPQITNALKQLSQQHGVTLFMTILSAWSAVLSRLSGQDDIVIGTPSANRSHRETESMIGFFVNTVALRIDLSNEPTTRQLLERVKRGTVAAYANQDLPFEQVVEIVQPPRKMDHTPLFQVMLAWENSEAGQWDLPGLEVTNQELDYDAAKYDLTLALCENNGGISGSLQYATSLFDRTSIERHVGYLHAMVRAMVTDVDQPVACIEMLSPDERRLVLETWNDTTSEYPDSLCLHQLFELQVERTPDAPAVVYENQSLSYSQLNVRANRLAHHLIHLGVQPDTLVALCVKRSLEMVIGILAVLKAGGAYVPLDPIYASERLRDIVQDAAPLCLVADSVGQAALGDFKALPKLQILDLDNDSALAHPTTNPQIKALNSHHLAYIIYTSGTTGKPKGVMVEHQGVVSLVLCRQKHLLIQPTSRMTQFFSVSFDPSLLEIFGTLGFGGALHVLQENVRMDRYQLWDYLVEKRITHAILTPAVLQEFDDSSVLIDMHTLLIGGEALSATLARKVRQIVPSGAIINEYGPTEASVAALSWRYTDDGLQERAPIGRPFSNRRVYLLDANGTPVPLGAVGEIYIGGIGVARGYLNRPELTAEKFLSDPFSSEAGARMYKTGDLGRYLPDGNLICLGRNDHQVKVRGFRIELGEIESRLSEHPLVSEAVVIARGEGGSKKLVAYVTPRDDNMELQHMDTTERK
ncbi:unnamed protein product [Mortierella alpina]